VIGLVPHPAQRELLGLIEQHRIVVAACGRRFGKSKASAAAALWNLLLTPELDGLVGPGERRYAVCVANSETQARIWKEHAAQLVKASPTLRGELVSETSTELEFRGGRVLAAFPASARTGRGYAISFLALDELAHALDVDEGGPQTQERLWSSMTPSVAQFGAGGRIVATSTPLGTDGLFAELYQKARNGEIEGAAAFHAPTSANPMIDAGYLAGQETALGGDDFRREFGAEFLLGGAAFIEAGRLAEVVADRLELPATAGTRWLAALDPSFSRDATALAVVGRDRDDRERLVLGYCGRWLPRRPRRVLRSREETAAVTDEILDAVAAVLGRFGLHRVISDQHAPGVVTHELGKRGVSVKVAAWTATSRTEALQALRARIYGRRIELYDPGPAVPLLAEAGRLRTRYRAGSSQVEVPRVSDSHGDCVLAVAAAVYEHDRHGSVRSTFSVPQGRVPVVGSGTNGGLDELSRVTGFPIYAGTY
jgi:hypothetical protein